MSGYVSYEQAMANAASAVAERKRTEAVELAESRQDYYVKWGYNDVGVKTEGPFSEADKDELVNRLFLGTEVDTLVVLKVVEVYKG